MKILLLFLLISAQTFGQQSLGALQGTIVDDTGEPLPFVRVLVYADSTSIVAGAETDFDGRFSINSVAHGVYTLKIKEYDEEMKINAVEVYPETVTRLGEIILTHPEIIGCDFGIPYYSPIRLAPFGGPTVINSEDIRIRY